MQGECFLLSFLSPYTPCGSWGPQRLAHLQRRQRSPGVHPYPTPAELHPRGRQAHWGQRGMSSRQVEDEAVDGRGGRRSPEQQGGPGQGRAVALREDWFFFFFYYYSTPPPVPGTAVGPSTPFVTCCACECDTNPLPKPPLPLLTWKPEPSQVIPRGVHTGSESREGNALLRFKEMW